jgi:hypothetical protein
MKANQRALRELASRYPDEFLYLYVKHLTARDGDGSCPSCGSGSRAELAYVPGRTGQPVSCSDDWHDEDAREPGSQELPR